MSTEINTFFHSITQVETRTGFDDLVMIEKAKKIPLVTTMIKKMSKLGYKYAGDTRYDGDPQSASKANTELSTKRIRIGRDKTEDEAILSLTYEMTNAKNTPKLSAVEKRFFEKDSIPTHRKADMYAREILYIEAEAVFNRSVVAIKLGKTDLVKNKKYIQVIIHISDETSAIQAIYEEMAKNGSVNNGQKKALDHYMEQYFEEHSARSTPKEKEEAPEMHPVALRSPKPSIHSQMKFVEALCIALSRMKL